MAVTDCAMFFWPRRTDFATDFVAGFLSCHLCLPEEKDGCCDRF